MKRTLLSRNASVSSLLYIASAGLLIGTALVIASRWVDDGGDDGRASVSPDVGTHLLQPAPQDLKDLEASAQIIVIGKVVEDRGMLKVPPSPDGARAPELPIRVLAVEAQEYVRGSGSKTLLVDQLVLPGERDSDRIRVGQTAIMFLTPENSYWDDGHWAFWFGKQGLLIEGDDETIRYGSASGPKVQFLQSHSFEDTVARIKR